MEIQRSKGLANLNRRVHIHLGLFLLLFICLFSFSGLLMNNGGWEISKFWEQREESKTVFPITRPESKESDAIVESVISQLKIEGEISNLKTWPDSLHFTVSIPGHVRNLRVDYGAMVCTQNEIKLNWSGKIQGLHNFNGLNRGKNLQPNWQITALWRLAMDGIAIGLILLCVSSWIIWYRRKSIQTWGWVVLISGFGLSIYFVFILGML